MRHPLASIDVTSLVSQTPRVHLSDHYGISTTLPFEMLDDDEKDILLYGSGSTVIHDLLQKTARNTSTANRGRVSCTRLEKTYAETTSERTRNRLIACMTDLTALRAGVKS